MTDSMVAYTMTQGDVEMGLEERTVVVVEKSSSSGWMWKACVALLVVALCSVGALLFAWYWTGGPTAMMQQGETKALTEKHTGAIADPRHMLRRISSNAKAAIHLEGSYEDDNAIKDQVEWRADQGQAFAQGGFRLEENQIIIPHTGLYFVYSQASFRVTCGDGVEESAAKRTAPPLSHRIWRYSDSIGSKATLMSAVRSACQRAAIDDSYRVGQGWYNAIYLGAVFRLKKGDKLWTETKQLSELESEEGRTFFGVFAL